MRESDERMCHVVDRLRRGGVMVMAPWEDLVVMRVSFSPSQTGTFPCHGSFRACWTHLWAWIW